MSGGSSTERGEPNLTPVLDMVFQLITFFMLVINFKSANLDLRLKLPVVGSARPAQPAEDRDRLVLNIDSEGKLTAYGFQQEPEAFLTSEARSARELLRLQGKPLGPDEPLPTTVVIRADRNTTFSQVNRVLKACQAVGYLKYGLKTLSSEGNP